MVVTVTPNPALDVTIWVDRIALGAVNRFGERHLDPAGKGINVSRMAHRLGWPTIAFGFLAGETGAIVAQSLAEEHVQHHFLAVPGRTRINFTVIERGRATSFFGPGPEVGLADGAALDELLRLWLPVCRVVVFAGSLPPGMAPDTYARWVHAARERQVQVVLDAEGEPLRLGVEARPDVIKPNLQEAERLLGRALPDLAAVTAAARELVGRGVRMVIISMGAEGSVCAHAERTWRVLPPPIEQRSTVGSGDSMVAGLAVALARGDDVKQGLILGTAAGAATAASPGTVLATRAQVEALLAQVRLEGLSQIGTPR